MEQAAIDEAIALALAATPASVAADYARFKVIYEAQDGEGRQQLKDYHSLFAKLRAAHKAGANDAPRERPAG